MRYIPDFSGGVILQVPEDKNSFINVFNVGATGKGNIEFTGTVKDVQENILTIEGIQDGLGGSLFQYEDVLKSGVDLQLFLYRLVTTAEDPVISVSSNTSEGVDFSSSTFVNPNLAPLRYYVFGYDQQSGRLPNFRSLVEVGQKVLNPDLWNENQYVELNFARTSQYAIPVIYRVWGNRVDFLGVVGNNKVGYPDSGNVSFRDLGLTEISNWDTSAVLPSFMGNIFSVGGSEVTQLRSILGKEKVTIRPNQVGSRPNYIECDTDGSLTGYDPGVQIRFVIDDTKYVQQAVNLARTLAVKDVFFPSGTYNISDLFFTGSSYSSIGIRGAGESSLIRRLPSTLSNSSNPGLINFTGPGISGTRVSSIAFSGNRLSSFSNLSPSETEATLSLSLCDNVVIDSCSFTDNAGAGILINSSNNVSLTRNRVVRTGRSYEQASSPFQVTSSQNLVVQGNIFELATTGPKVVSTDFSTVNGNIVRGCGDRGIELQTSYQWNAQGNLAYSDNDSVIRSIDTYNNEYSRATIEVRRGFALDPVYMTVTYGGESVQILKNSVRADIFSLSSEGQKQLPAVGGFRVLETSAQLDAGIFSLTLPGTTVQTFNGQTIVPTSSLTDPDGYVYEVRASVLIGSSIRPLSIRNVLIGSITYVALQLRNPSDILSLQIYAEGSLENDLISVRGFSNTNLNGWDQNSGYQVVGIDTDTNSILLNPIPGLTLSPTPIEFIGGNLSILRSNYFVADGNLYVHTF